MPFSRRLAGFQAVATNIAVKSSCAQANCYKTGAFCGKHMVVTHAFKTHAWASFFGMPILMHNIPTLYCPLVNLMHAAMLRSNYQLQNITFLIQKPDKHCSLRCIRFVFFLPHEVAIIKDVGKVVRLSTVWVRKKLDAYLSTDVPKDEKTNICSVDRSSWTIAYKYTVRVQ